MTDRDKMQSISQTWDTLFDENALLENDDNSTRQLFSPIGSRSGIRKHFSESEAEGYRDFIRLSPYLNAVINNFAPKQDLSYRLAGKNQFSAHFQVSGGSFSEFSQRQTIDLSGAQCAILFQPSEINEWEFFPAGTWEKSITISCKTEILAQIFVDDPGCLAAHLREMIFGNSNQLFVETMPIMPRMCDILKQLLTMERHGPLRALHIEALAMELLCELFNHQNMIHSQRGHSELSNRDIQNIHKAHKYLRDSFPRQPSTAEISQHVALNRNKLCHGFKTIFGQTISEYCQTQRMQTAGNLLRQTDHTIKDISLSVGYENVASFSTVFKRHYSITPTEYRNLS